MLKKLFKYKLRVAMYALLILLFVLIRVFENQLFYDPFLNYFKADYTNLPLPVFNSFKLVLSICFRYGMNTMISLAMLYLIFNDYNMIKFTLIVYLMLFVVLLILFFSIVVCCESSRMTIFYIRRFLMQPIFVLLFIPGFYYQKLGK